MFSILKTVFSFSKAPQNRLSKNTQEKDTFNKDTTLALRTAFTGKSVL